METKTALEGLLPIGDASYDTLLFCARIELAAQAAHIAALDEFGNAVCHRAELAEQHITELEAALKQSMVAIDDWLNIYASEECDPKRVGEAWQRVQEGGTLFYIASVQKINRAALNRGRRQTEGMSDGAA